MRSIPDQATAILNTVLLQDAQMRAAGLPANTRFEALTPGLCGLLQQFQDELLEAQRQSAIALAEALNMMGGK